VSGYAVAVTGGFVGFGIPLELTESGVLGTDYDESNPRPGRDATGSTRGTRLVLSGYPAATAGDEVAAYLTARAQPTAKASGGSWAWRRDGAGSWYGGDAPTAIQRAQIVDSGPVSGTSIASSISTIVSTTGYVLVVWGEVLSTGDVQLRSRDRASTAWSQSPVTIHSVGDDTLIAGGVGCCAVALPDGRAAVYGIYSADGGVTWTVACWESVSDAFASWVLQSTDCLGTTYTSDPPRLIRACLTPGGTTALFVVRHTSTSTRTTQYVSGDGIRFTLVGTADEGTVVIWDARIIEGKPRVLYEINDDGTARIGSTTFDPGSAVWGDCTVAACWTTSTDAWIAGGAMAPNHYGPGWWAVTYNDTLTLWSSSPISGEMSSTTSTSYALTPSDGSGAMGQGQMWWYRGSLYIVGGRRSASTLDGYVAEARCGGQSDLTLTRWWPTLPQWIGLASADLSGSWGDTDIGGGVTRTMSYTTGLRIQTDGISQGREQSSDLGTIDRILAIVQVTPTSGTCLVRVQHTNDGANVYAVHVEITPTTIVMYDATGAAGATTSITVTSDVTVMIWLQGSTARCWYRLGEPQYPLKWSTLTLTGITTAAGSTSYARAGAAISSDIKLIRLGVIDGDGTPTYPTPGDVDDVAGVVLSGSETRYMADNMYARVIGVPVRVDTANHVIPITAPYPREHADPYVVASPASGWQMTASMNQSIDLNAGDRYVPGDAQVLYLGGLRNVPKITLAGFPVTTGVIDLRTALAYTTEGNTVTPLGTGGAVAGWWVGADELAGSQFECHDGTVLDIVSNTAGSLRSGTASEHRAVITLSDDAGTDGTGYIWPRNVGVLIMLGGYRTGSAAATLTLPSTLATPSGEGWRTIGTLALCDVVFAGISPDRTTGRESVIGDELVELEDGSAYVVRRKGTRRRVELAWVESPHDWTGMIGPESNGSPPYIQSPDTGDITGTAQGGQVIASLLASHGRRPLVVLDGCIPVSGYPDGGVIVLGPVPWRRGCYYCTAAGNPRTEDVPTYSGVAGRLQVIPLQEIL